MMRRKLFLRTALAAMIAHSAAYPASEKSASSSSSGEATQIAQSEPVQPADEAPPPQAEPVIEPVPEVIEEPKPEELPPPPPAEVSPEVKLMQAIEPGFIPKDDRAVQLFLLQKIVADNKDALDKKMEQADQTRDNFSRKFREDLSRVVAERISAIDAKLDASIDEAIRHFENAVKHHPNNKTFRAEALYRLGLYYFERDEKDYFDKLARYNEAREQGRDDVAYPDENFERTIQTYETLIKEYPQHRHSDGVYYLLALAHWYEGAFDYAMERFQELIAQYPKSRYVEEVWFRLGEYLYDMTEFDNAIAAYERVAKNPQSPLYDKAAYKIAWSHYQKDRFMTAIDEFIKVLDITAQGEGAAASMRAEVIRYIVKSFGEQLIQDESKKGGAPKPKPTVAVKAPINPRGKAPVAKEEPAPQKKPKLEKAEKEYAEKIGMRLSERIIAYFNDRKNPRYTREILVETASQLLDEQKIQGAILAFDRTIALEPQHQDNPRLASQIVDILQDDDRQEDARVRNQQLIRTYGKKSRWYRSHENNYLAQSHAREAVRDAMLALAVYHHKMGKDFKDAKDNKAAETHFRQAASLYSSYVREYPEREDTHKAIFYMAEAAYELNRFRLALDAYQLLKDYPLPMPEGMRRDATFNIVFTFRHVLENEAKRGNFREIDFDALTSKSRGTEPVEIPELGVKYLSSIDEFLKIAPDDEQVPVLLFHAAAIYYVYGHSDDAQSRFYFIIDTYPKTSAASVAARLVIDDAVSKEEWARVVELAQRFKAQNLGGNQGDFARIEGNAKFKIARAVYEEANELQKNNQNAEAKAKFKQSSEMFASLLAEDPKNPYADVMIFNSARAIVLSGSTAAAIPLYRKLYKEYPDSEYAKSARFQEALALEKMLKFSEAANAYDGIIKQDPKSETAGDAMLNKALLYEAAGDLPNAAVAFVEFAKRYPERQEAPDAYLSAASTYKKMGKVNQQIAMLEQFIKQYRRDKTKIPAVIEAHVQIADTYGDLERNTNAPAQKKNYEKLRRDNYRSAVELYSQDLNSPLASFFAAKAQLALEKPEQDAFKNLTIKARLGKDQGEELTKMMKALSELSAKNEAIIRVYAQPVWNAEALRRIGALYEHLAKTMVRAPCPRDVAAVDEYACDEYTVLLEDKAAVLEGKALDAYRQAYDIAMTAYDSPPDLVSNILAGLNRLRPGEYQRVGNLIEQPKTGAVYGQGRMLSTRTMASTLHPQEKDPDKKAPEPVIEVVPPAKEEPAPTDIKEEENLQEPAPAEDEFGDELGEDFE